MLDYANQILKLLDLTSLNDHDNNVTINKLCHKTTHKFGHVAAVCVFSRFVPLAKADLAKVNTKVKVATVVNFPHGSDDLDLAQYETSLALTRGCDEVDLVFPYHMLMQG